jgi:DNA-3-methyladenine glycosylase
LPRAFYARGAVVVARSLLGRVLTCDLPPGRVSGRIVEVEAYRGALDPASHAYRGETPRNRVMFGPPGHAYVYFTYGMHHCLNLVCEREGVAAAVLVRALAPLEGLEVARARRGVAVEHRLMRGPGCVAQALGLTRAHDGLDLVRGPLRVLDRAPDRGGRRVLAGPRIGIRQGTGLAWRFRLEGHPCVSGPRGGAGANPRRRGSSTLTLSRGRP